MTSWLGIGYLIHLEPPPLSHCSFSMEPMHSHITSANWMSTTVSSTKPFTEVSFNHHGYICCWCHWVTCCSWIAISYGFGWKPLWGSQSTFFCSYACASCWTILTRAKATLILGNPAGSVDIGLTATFNYANKNIADTCWLRVFFFSSFFHLSGARWGGWVRSYNKLTCRWCVAKCASGMNSTGWVTMSLMGLKTVISTGFSGTPPLAPTKQGKSVIKHDGGTERRFQTGSVCERLFVLNDNMSEGRHQWQRPGAQYCTDLWPILSMCVAVCINTSTIWVQWCLFDI